MTSITLEPIYGSLLLALGSVVAVIATLLYVTPPTSSSRQRRVLILLRTFASLVLILSVLRPAIVRTDQRPAEASLIVAVDTSQSMTLPDGRGNPRWTSQVEVWKRLSQQLLGTDDSLSIGLLAYDKSTRRLSATTDALDSETPDGSLTDLSGAALAAMGSAEGRPLAGIVLIGDGTQTAPQQGAGAQRVAETLNSMGVPLWTVPIGPAGGQSAARDVAIDALPESYELFAQNEVQIEFQMQLRGLAGVDVPVRLTWTNVDGDETEFASRVVAASNASDTQSLSIRAIAPAPGAYRLTVAAAEQEGELVTTNNTQTAFVEVREGGGRILYLEGTARQEQSFLRRSLRRFQELDVTYRWIPSDTTRAWPVDLGTAFDPGRFDIYILGDLDASALGEKNLSDLLAAVSQGAGLVTMGGYQTYGAGGYATSALADAIPVEMDASRRRSIGSDLQDRTDQIDEPTPMLPTGTHPVTDLGDDNLEIWMELPPQIGVNRFVGPKIAAGIQVLLQSPSEQPLLVVGEYGSGRTAALAFDSTWLWWRSGDSDIHRRFWRQLVLWLLSREQTGEGQIVIEMDARRFAVDEPPEFRARVETVAQDRRQEELVAEIVDESGEVLPVEIVRTESDGTIIGRIPTMSPGIHRLQVRSSDSESDLEVAEKAFQVVDESLELQLPMADPLYLTQLADLTSDHGGAAYLPDDVDGLVETIQQRRRKSESPIVEKYRLGDGPLTGWIVFAVFAGTLSIEWFLRRRWGLV